MDIKALRESGTDVAPPTDDDLKFLALKNKSAARSHVDSPIPAAEQLQEDRRRRHPHFPACSARQDASWERENNFPVDGLDKENILKDHPEKYLLERPTAQTPDLLPPDAIPIPNTFPGRLVHNIRVTPADHWQDVRHLAFNLALSREDVKAVLHCSGNLTLRIYPKNYPEDVQELISMMGWDEMADTPIDLDSAPRGLYFRRGITTLRHFLTHNLDITAVPKRHFIKSLLAFTRDEREIERLQELTAAGNEQEFYDYTCRPRRTILELLRDFQGVRIPFDTILSLFPIIRGRDFSVCNAGKDILGDSDGIVRVEILAALVEYKTIIRKPRQGLCSRYLKHLPAGALIWVGLKAATGPQLVRDPASVSRPMIAIATGTGIAPIRALIQERAGYRHPGPTSLFFGCRNRSADFYFADEWREYPELVVYPAFSRDPVPPPESPATARRTTTTAPVHKGIADILTPPEYDAGKNYVQHLIRKHAHEVGQLMLNYPIVCICGNAGRMPLSVRSALLDALVISGVVENKDMAERWFADPHNLTLWQETW
jgi:sulfite reductase alpha subunit-like flavoprotein